MRTPRFIVACKGLYAFCAILLLLQSCGKQNPTSTVLPSPTFFSTETPAIPTPEPPEPTATLPTPTNPPPMLPAVEYDQPQQFIARLNLGEIKKFTVSPQLDTLVVGNTSHICLFNTTDYKLRWCTLTVPQNMKLTPEEASENDKLGKMVFRSDGQQIAVALWNGNILVMDSREGEIVNVIRVGQASISNLVWPKDIDQIMIYKSKEAIEVWDTSTGKFVRQLDIDPQGFSHLEWSSDASHFATADITDTRITVWDAVQVVPTSTFEIQSVGFVSSMAFSPDLKRLFVGIATPFPCEENCDDNDPEYKGWIAVYDIETGVLSNKVFVGDAISRLAVSPDGNWIAGGGGIRKSLVVVGLHTGRLSVKLFDTNADLGLGWLDNNRVLFLPYPNHPDAKSISEWDVRWTEHIEIYLPGFETIESVAWMPDSERLITNTAGGTITIWEARTGQQVEQFQLMFGGLPVQRFEPGWISPVEDLLAVTAEDSIAIIDLVTGQVFKWMDHADLGERINATDLVWSKDGQRLMAGIVDKEHTGRVAVAVWEVSTGKRLLTIPANYEIDIHKMTFSPDGKQIAMSRTVRGEDFKHQLVTMDVDTGKELKKLDMETDSFKVIWVLPNQIAFEYCSKTHVWNLTDGSEREIPGATSYPEIRSDGSLAASLCFGVGINLWDLKTGQGIKCLEIPADTLTYNSLSFSPDGRLLASLTDNGSVLLWDTSEFTTP